MQKLLFSLTLLQLFSLSANNSFDNGSKPFEPMNFLHQAPLNLVHNVFKCSPKLEDCFVLSNEQNKIFFLCPTNLTHEQYIALYKTYYDKLLEERDSKTKEPSEEQNTNDKNAEPTPTEDNDQN